jgi:hypothetical protein
LENDESGFGVEGFGATGLGLGFSTTFFGSSLYFFGSSFLITLIGASMMVGFSSIFTF